ncbi:Signal recognition particle 54 kDa protein [Candidatus Micrarchaeum sp.]|jgi:fused signal recognition particle receptor|uniref:signal recognition particle-docking protein FtsY n=1 Tax=Candidatus Micrarchaeum sp. TaxID=2282148 RepID=UPI000AAF5FF6|nr:signal recognition particle-docking protein FtsY [Candidatus Micrarchaeum sp.]QRF74468.1 Signal recognition particle 54 kDa protein [Candidatus Micrarchaeum sp.]
MFDSLRKKISNAIGSIVKSEREEEGASAEGAAAYAQKAEEERTEVVETAGAEKEEEKLPVEERKENETVTETAKEEKPESPAVEPLIEKAKKEEKMKLSLSTRLKGVFSKEVKLGESDIDNFTDELMLTLLQSDVSYETTDKFINSLKETLKSSTFESRNIREGVSDCVRSELSKVLKEGMPKEQLLHIVKGRLDAGMKPVSIMFLGPNGTGKTTTMAKIAYMFKKNGISSVFSASDTFRAAAIEQTSFHASKIGMPVIKGSYGADPASVAFDAIEYAKAHSSDTVLIDTAGRQETNKNLLNEIKKMERVAKPDITIYVGESTAGNRIAEQVAEFLKYIKIDGIILTKLDCDAKGGNAISLSDVTGLPIFFFGTGEGYEELMEFNPSFIIDSLVPN